MKKYLYEELSYIQYADDTNIFVTGKSLNDICNTIKSEMALVCEWMTNNKLSLNISKTHYMIMSSPRKKYDNSKNQISIDNHVLECVSVTKFLGVMLDGKLLWKSHIDQIQNKISKSIGILAKARKVLDTKSLVTLYNSLIMPYFTYCIIIWGNTYSTYLHRLHTCQKKIIRIITFSEFNAHTRPLLIKLKILNIYQLYEYFVGMFVYKSLHYMLPEMFRNFFIHNKTSRKTLDLRPGFCTSKTSEFQMKVTGPKIWNTISEKTRLSISLTSFKKRFKKELIMQN